MQPHLPSAADAPGPPASDGPLWQGVARLVARAETLSDLRLHRLHLLGLRQWRDDGRSFPSELLGEEQASAMLGLAAAFVLQRVRGAYDGRILVMKGPDVAAYYPDPALRPFRDLDLLVDDAAAAQRALVAKGFGLIGDGRLYADIHHLQPLRWPGIPLGVEIHDRPKWLDGQKAPPTAELFEAAVPSRTAVAGVETLAPEHQAVALAIHSWAHVPLARVGHLVDVAAVAQGLSRPTLDSLADAWGVGRVWRATTAAGDGLLTGGRVPLSVRTWARNIASVRERTVLESHLQRWLAPYWDRPAGAATVALVRALRRDVVPAEGETWSVKRARVAQAIRTPRRRLSEHQGALEERSISGPSYLERLDRKP